jgi:hypothetical protein
MMAAKIQWSKEKVLERVQAAMSYGSGTTTPAQDALKATLTRVRERK